MIENIKLSFQGIFSHKLRSFLTMLGIIIGIAAIISIVSTILGTNEQIKNNLIGSGNNTVKITLARSGYTYEFNDVNDVPYGIPVISEEELKEILRSDSIASVSRYVQRSYCSDISYQGETLTGACVMGVDRNYFYTCGYELREGRGFTYRDEAEKNKILLLDETAASAIFQEQDPIGKTLEVKGEPFTVVGVMKESYQFEPVIESVEDYYTYASDSSGVIYLPDYAWPIVYRSDEPQNVVVKAASTDEMTRAGKVVTDILNAKLKVPEGSDLKYKADDLLEQSRKLQDLSNATNLQLIWIASISLLVGGIGVMNIMLVSVTERTSEIGLKMALGAKKRTILGQFLTEAAVLTSMGGIIGVFAGVGLAEVISRITGTPVAVSIPAILAAVLFSTCIGLIFGILPSWKASRMNPIDALRRE